MTFLLLSLIWDRAVGQRDGLSPWGEPSLLNSQINHNLCLSTPFSLLSSLSFPLFPSLYLPNPSTPCRLHLSTHHSSPLLFFRARSLSLLRLSIRLYACMCGLVTHSLGQIRFCAPGFGSTSGECLREVKALRLL